MYAFRMPRGSDLGNDQGPFVHVTHVSGNETRILRLRPADLGA